MKGTSLVISVYVWLLLITHLLNYNHYAKLVMIPNIMRNNYVWDAVIFKENVKCKSRL